MWSLEKLNNFYIHCNYNIINERNAKVPLGKQKIRSKFEVFTVVKVWVKVFWVMMPCSVVGYQCFRGHAASIFRVTSETTTRRHNPEEPYLKHHRRENLKTRIIKVHDDIKSKLSLYFNWAPLHEGVLGDWRYSSAHSWSLTR